MKKIIVCAVLALTATVLVAQEAGKIRGGINIGAALPNGGGGVALDFQLGYNIVDNMAAGLKIGLAAM